MNHKIVILYLTDCFAFFSSEEEMEDKGNQQEPNASSAAVYKVPGEPAVVINGVPDITPGGSTTPPPNPLSIVEYREPTLWGELFEGREVKKWFMGRFYSGTVTEFDKENRWFRVRYEDGDTEDLNWRELDEVLLPLDAKIPLKKLAKSVVKKNAKSAKKSAKKVAAHSLSPKIKKKTTKGKQIILP